MIFPKKEKKTILYIVYQLKFEIANNNTKIREKSGKTFEKRKKHATEIQSRKKHFFREKFNRYILQHVEENKF